MTLALLGNTLLRTAITRNLVSFPAQIRPFVRRNSGDMQERIVQLYFVRGWSVRNICARYRLSKAMAHKLLAEWRIRAVESGYIQEIEPGILAALQQSNLEQTNLEAIAPQPLPAYDFAGNYATNSASALPASMPLVEGSVGLSVGSVV
jgi:hypothetical protein